jgi:tRNA(Ile)-lysidine synthase
VAVLAPAVAAVRAALRATLASVPPGAVLVACSGGADSLALAAGTAFVATRLGFTAGLVTVDHQLQPGSADQARAVSAWARATGFDPVVVETVEVSGRSGGPEAAAREARYEALVRAARRHGAGTVLLGHTRDDQAETVLLALVRGAGPRGLVGMPVRREVGGIALVRPLLEVSRAQTQAACEALALPVWSDPHNADPAYRRVRARELLASLTQSLGGGVVANLARTAALLAADAEALDALAAQVLAEAGDLTGLAVPRLRVQPAAIRTRVLHAWARSLGVSGSALSSRHVAALDALIMDWHGQGPTQLPGGIEVTRRGGRLQADLRADLDADLHADPDADPRLGRSASRGEDTPTAMGVTITDEAGLSHGRG